VEERDLQAWFATYLETFTRLGRGDWDDIERVLDYFGVPLLLSAPQGLLELRSREEILDVMSRQMVAVRESGYDRSEVLETSVEVVNARCALYRGRFARLRRDGSEIERLRVTYVITGGADGPRVSALLIHG
jgi:hypothetical protein